MQELCTVQNWIPIIFLFINLTGKIRDYFPEKRKNVTSSSSVEKSYTFVNSTEILFSAKEYDGSM